MYDKTYIEIHVFKPSLINEIENANDYMYELTSRGLIPGSDNFSQQNYDDYIQDVKYFRMKYDDPEEKHISNIKLILGKVVIFIRSNGGCGIYNGTENSSQAALSLRYRDYLALDSISFGAGLRIKNITHFTRIIL